MKLPVRLNLGRTFATLAVAATLALAAVQAQAGPKDGLTEATKQHLMAAKPILGKGIDAATFDGKPVAVVFFASW